MSSAMPDEMINIFGILKKGLYTTDDFIKIFQKQLYDLYNIVLLDEDIEQWVSGDTYNTDDVVYTYKLGAYKIFVSLIDNNTEPLNNNEAWEETTNIFIGETELNTMIDLLIDIIPFNLYDIFVRADDERGVNKLKYILGLFLACFLANKYSNNSTAGGGIGIATYKSIDGLTASFKVPDYALEPENLFFINNPFGNELLSLYNRLLVDKVGMARKNLYFFKDWATHFFPNGF